MTKRLFAAVLIGLSVSVPVFARTPNDPDYSEQWYLEQIGAPAAWDMVTGTRDVVVAVLDSGVDLDHPDLAANIWKNQKEVAGNGVDDDDNGYVDDNRGWDFVQDDNTPEPDLVGSYSVDGVAHGTVIAGLIGAVGNNDEGVSGVTWKTRIMPLRILDNLGSGESMSATKAIRYAVANGADVINLSFVGYEIDSQFEKAVNEAYVAGIPIVAAVGNQEGGGLDVDVTPLYPACFEGTRADWVIGVAATTQDDVKAEFSNYGENCTEISAPGEELYGTMYYAEDRIGLSEYYKGGWSGTSVAAPLVTGAAALLKSAYPSLTPSLIRTVLQLSADPIKERGTPSAGKLGAGRLNVARALEIAPAFAADVAEETAGSVEMGTSPVTGQPEEITPVSSGMFIRSPGFDTVYYVDGDNARHPLWDKQTYFTWKDSWDDITWVTDATLPTLSLGAALLPKPGVSLVKIQSDTRVYAVEEGEELWKPVLREIPSEEIAESVYGETWSEFVIDVEPTLFSHYAVGEAMTEDTWVDLGLLKTRSSLGN